MERPEYEFGRQDLDFLHWWGVPTLFRCPHVPDPAECDIALVGLPHSTGNGTTWRDQHLDRVRCATCRWRTGAIDRAGACPVSVGGEHSISLAILRAIAGPDSRHGQPVAVVHVDATRSVQIGTRGHDVWMDPGKTNRELGYRIVTKDESMTTSASTARPR